MNYLPQDGKPLEGKGHAWYLTLLAAHGRVAILAVM